MIFFLSGAINWAKAQKDSLVFKNRNLIIGEIKSMDRGVIIIERDYSDSDFKVKWEQIVKIQSKTKFLISLVDGRRFNGKIWSVSESEVKTTFYGPESLIRLKKKQISKDSKGSESIILPIKK